MMIDEKDVRMYIRSRHSAFDTPQQIADSLKEIEGGKYTAQAVEKILRSMGYRPYTENRRSEEAERSEAHRRMVAVEKLKGIVHAERKTPAANKIKENDYVPQVIYDRKVRDKIRILHAEDKTIASIARTLGKTRHQIEDTIIDLGLRPVYSKKSRKTAKTLSEEEKREVVEYYAGGLSSRVIASMYDVSAKTVINIYNAKKKLKGQIML